MCLLVVDVMLCCLPRFRGLHGVLGSGLYVSKLSPDKNFARPILAGIFIGSVHFCKRIYSTCSFDDARFMTLADIGFESLSSVFFEPSVPEVVDIPDLKSLLVVGDSHPSTDALQR